MISELIREGNISGIPFNFTQSLRSGGRKTVFHTFVGSDAVMGEDLGKAPVSFKMSIYIHGILGEYFSKRDALIAQLEKPSSNILEHPTYGNINVMLDGGYVLNETITRLGDGRIDVTFKVVDNDNLNKDGLTDGDLYGMVAELNYDSPTDSADGSTASTASTSSASATASNVNSDESPKAKLSVGGNEATGAKIEPSFFDKISSFQKNYKNSIYYKGFKLANKGLAIYEDTQRAGYLKSSASILENIDAVQEIWQGSSALMQGSEKYSEFVGLVDDLDFINTGKSLVNGLSTVGEGLGGIFAFFEGNNSDAEARFVAFDQFSSYGDDVVANSTNQQTSLENIETYNNNVANRDYMQLLGLVYQANAFIDIDFKTESELLNAELNIQGQLTKQISKYSDNQSMYRDLQGLKILVNAQANSLRIGLLKLIEVEVVNSSLMDITYSYYGNLNNYEIIKTLNNFYNPSNITGTVKVLVNG